MIEFLQKIIIAFHVSLFVVFTIGPFMSGKYLIYYLFLWPSIIVHWYFNDGNCMLTEIEYNIDGQHYNGINEYIFHSKSGFFSILNILHRFFPNFDYLNNGFNYYRSILWIIAFIRALIFYRKDITKWWENVRKHFISRFICDSCRG
jgi:hypothetical protein